MTFGQKNFKSLKLFPLRLQAAVGDRLKHKPVNRPCEGLLGNRLRVQLDFKEFYVRSPLASEEGTT